MGDRSSQKQTPTVYGPQDQHLQYTWDQGRELYTGPQGQYFAPGLESYIPDRDPAYAAAIDRLEQRGMLGSPVTTAAQAHSTRTLSGGYLGQNEYVDARVKAGLRDITREYQRVKQPETTSRFAAHRRSMSPAHFAAEREDRARLIEEMGQYESDVRGTHWESERDRMVRAGQTAPLIGQMDIQDLEALRRAGAEREGYETAKLAEQQEAHLYPWEALERYRALLGSPILGYTGRYKNPSATAILGNVGAGMGVGGQAIGAIAGAAMCHVAAEFYGWGSPEWCAARRWIVEGWQGRCGDAFRHVYRRHGRRVAGWVRRNRLVRAVLRPVFAWACRRGEAMEE